MHTHIVIVEGDGDNSVEHMWEQVKWAMVESVREVWLSESRRQNPKSVWWNDEVKAAVRRKEALAARDEEAKRVGYIEAYKGERLEGIYIKAKRK